MIDEIELIINEWSKKIPSGIIDYKNENHLYELEKILNDKIDDPQITKSIMENIKEQTRERY